MTQQNPLALLQAFSPQASNIIGSVQAGSNLLTQGLNRDILKAQEDRDSRLGELNIQQQEIVNRGLAQQENIQNTVSRLNDLERQISFGATPEQLANTLQGYITQSQERGGNPVDSTQALQALQQGGVEGLSNLLGQAKQTFMQQGLIKAPATSNGVSDAFAKIDPAKFTPESVAAFEQTGQFASLIPIAGEEQDPVYIKELRDELRKDVSQLTKDANTLTTNFGKLDNLAEEMRSGNRSAVAQGLVALVKLGDPGSVVREEELKQALGAQNPAAAIADTLRGKGVGDSIINSVVQSLDPLNPAAVNVDQVLSTAEAMLRPNIYAITSSYNMASSRGGDHLKENEFNSIFGRRGELFENLSGLTFGDAPPTQSTTVIGNIQGFGDITEEDIQETMRANNLTREQVINQLGL